MNILDKVKLNPRVRLVAGLKSYTSAEIVELISDLQKVGATVKHVTHNPYGNTKLPYNGVLHINQ
jgi:hypothetical protein